jgi:transcriptional regulator with XRE-family HTH domain
VNKYSTKSIGLRLKSGIADNGYSYKDFADSIGSTEGIVKNWANGRTAIPIDAACKICDLLDWPMDRLAVRGEWDDQVASVK